MSTQNVKDYFYRHFLGVVKVNSLPTALAGPQVFSQKRDVEVHPIQIGAKIKVTGADLLPSGGISCSSRGFRFASQLLKTNETKIKRYASGEVALRTFSKLKTKTRSETKRVAVLPQERANRLQWQTVRPKKEGEMILAWFGPIVEDAVAKLTLNKRLGTLLIWYNPQSRHFNVKGLYLYRRVGLNENLEWRWM